MEYYRSINNLQQLKVKLLTMTVQEAEIVEFIQDMNKQTAFDDVNSNLLVFEIYYLLTVSDMNFIPLIKMSLDALPYRIITETTNEEDIVVPEKADDVKEVEVIPAVKCCDEPECKCGADSDVDLNKLKAAIIKKWVFSPTNFPDVKRPSMGELGNVQFVEEELIPGKKFSVNANIDWEGNIITFLSGPTEMLNYDSYQDIYAGLVGQLFDIEDEAN
jgi:hypothetical protein